MLGLIFALAAVQDGEAPLRAAIDNLRSAASYRYEFRTHVEILDNESDPFNAEGVGVISGGVVSTEVKATGQIHRVIVATEKAAMIWHRNMEAWVDSVAYGEPDAGRGVQNANSLLKAIEGELAGAAVGAPGEYTLKLEGDAIKRVTGRLGVGFDGAVWAKSSATMKVSVAAATGRIRAVSFESEIQVEPKGGGSTSIKTTADVTIVEYDGAKLIGEPTIEGKKVPIAEALKDLGLDPKKFK